MTAKKPTRKTFLLRLNPELHQELMIYAGVRQEALSDILGKVVEDWWKANPDRKEIVKVASKVKAKKKQDTPEEEHCLAS